MRSARRRTRARFFAERERIIIFRTMKGTLIRVIGVGAMLVAFASVAWAGVAGVQVTVSDHAGKLVYRGRTDASGVFSTPGVASGDYVVQLNSNDASAERKDYAIFAAAGKHRVVADAIEGAKLRAGGVALRLKVAPGTPIMGQIVLGGVNALGTKIVNGKRFVLV